MSLSIPEPTPLRPRPVLIAGAAVAVLEAIVRVTYAFDVWRSDEVAFIELGGGS